MSGNLIDLRRRIKSVKNTQKITRAMKTVSAAKLRRSTTDLNRNRPVVERLWELLVKTAKKQEASKSELTMERKEGDYLIVVLGSDKGLCGAFNSHIYKKAENRFKELKEKGEEVLLITIGNKVYKYFNKREYPIKKNYESMMKRVQYMDSIQLSEYLQKIFTEENIKKVEFIYTEFQSASRQSVNVKQLFPLEENWEEGENNGNIDDEVEYIFEPSAEEIFKKVLPKFIDLLVYRLLLESEASENAARMIAMELATNNADEMIRGLTLVLNKLRQASITKELLEIITATEALKK